jgi:SPRY domain-containing SOCS box protein 1/4
MLKMFRLIENWPQFRATIVNINTDLYSIVRSIKSTTNDNNNNNSNNNEVKHEDSVREAHAERPARLDRLLRTDAVTIDVQIMNSWSTVDKSPYINILEEGLVGKRRPVAKSTDCMRGRIGYTNGLHVWSINWPQDCRGTHAMVGVATDSAPLHATGLSFILISFKYFY